MKKEIPSVKARVLVLIGPAIAFLFTLYVIGVGGGANLLFAVWFLAVIWTFLTAFAGALWHAFRGDRTVFTGYELPEGDGDRFDWATRTGRHAWRREYEEGELHAHDDYPGHGPIT